MYLRGGHSDLIRVYDTNTKEFTGSLGNVNEEHLVLGMNKSAGGMTWFKDKLFFATASRLQIYNTDPQDQKTDSISLSDKEFQVGNIKDGKNMVNNNKKGAIAYLMENSHLSGMSSTKDQILIRADVGEMKMKDDKLDIQDRYQKFYLLESDLKPKGAGKIPFSLNSNPLYAAVGNTFYCLRYNIDSANPSYELVEIVFSEGE